MEQPSSNIDHLIISFTVPDAEQGIRLDHFLVHKLSDSSRARIVSAVKQGLIVVNGGGVKAGYRLKGGDLISGRLGGERSDGATPQPQPIDFT
ncbi:MAG: hypothetical protein IH612_17290, partial [Desulfofustis sp.]|nr:hypothetical protein [Desulfofustis sp.]